MLVLAEAANPVTFDFWTFAFEAINILIILYFLRRFLFGPITKMIETRREGIESSLREAEEARAEAQRILDEYQQKVSESQGEAQAIIERATKAANARREELIEAARAESDQLVARAKQEIEAERQRVLSSIRDEAAQLVLLATSRVIERSVDADDQKRFIDDVIADLNRKGPDAEALASGH